MWVDMLEIQVAKLKKTKVAVREWNKKVFGRTNEKIDMLEIQVETLQNRLQLGWDVEVARELSNSSTHLAS